MGGGASRCYRGEPRTRKSPAALERPGHGHRRNGNTVTSEENSTTEIGEFGTMKYGEWEKVGDRIKRRPIFQKRTPDVVWLYEYSISRNYEGEIFTAITQFSPEMLSDADVEALNTIIRDAFFGTLSDAVKICEGSWIQP